MLVENWPVTRLIPFARNPRKNDEVIDKMVEAIKEFGFRIPIMARSDGTIVDGHLRLKAAQQIGITEVPVTVADDLTEAQIQGISPACQPFGSVGGVGCMNCSRLN